MMNPTTWLPTEMWALIASHLVIEDKMSMSLVSRIHHAAVRDPVAWSDIKTLEWEDHYDQVSEWRPPNAPGVPRYCVMRFGNNRNNDRFEITLQGTTEASTNRSRPFDDPRRVLSRRGMMTAAKYLAIRLKNVVQLRCWTENTIDRKYARDMLDVFIDNAALPRLKSIRTRSIIDETTACQLKRLLRSNRPIVLVDLTHAKLGKTDTAWPFFGLTELQLNYDKDSECFDLVDIDSQSLREISLHGGIPPFVEMQYSLKKLVLHTDKFSPESMNEVITYKGTPMQHSVEQIAIMYSAIHNYANIWHFASALFPVFDKLSTVTMDSDENFSIEHGEVALINYVDGVVEIFKSLVRHASTSAKRVAVLMVENDSDECYAMFDLGDEVEPEPQPMSAVELARANEIADRLSTVIKSTAGGVSSMKVEVKCVWTDYVSMIQYNLSDGVFKFESTKWMDE